ncbi:hypothetical protein [Candidatus Mycoplasma haematohominis]|uniref:Uncharacterized protein n=1 Tax=Candidatus Mycoplasma haematohominis TaxID=1494318 RepID=A0A478FRP4_9MOLU|nr:hypothetical protein [Candidatus Mycoplasma haemohominis]GCE63734.1 hypothetical protein MHSWG343_07340 [Candidatus Mycoplasma haemohominis]
MSTQAIGAAAAGTAVLGGGGVTIAYAAGAFSASKTQEEERDTYLTQAKKELQATKDYIGNDKTRIQGLLSSTSDTPAYKTTLSGVWGNMSETELKTKDSSLEKPADSEIQDSTKASSVADYVNKWCTHISNKQLDIVPTTSDANRNTWDAFKAACFADKTPPTAPGA